MLTSSRSLDVKSAAGDPPPTSIDDMPNMLRCATLNRNTIHNLLITAIDTSLSASVYTLSWAAVWLFWGRQWLPLSVSSQVCQMPLYTPMRSS